MKILHLAIVTIISTNLSAEFYSADHNWNTTKVKIAVEMVKPPAAKETKVPTIEIPTVESIQGAATSIWGFAKELSSNAIQYSKDKYYTTKETVNKKMKNKESSLRNNSYDWNKDSLFKKPSEFFEKTMDLTKTKYKENIEKFILKNPVTTYKVYKTYEGLKK